MDADLADALMFAHRFDHPAPFGDAQGKRFFDVDILARFDRVYDHLRVPMIGRGDHHGVDCTVLEHALVIVEGLGSGGCGLEPGLQVGFVNIANRGHIDAQLFEVCG